MTYTKIVVTILAFLLGLWTGDKFLYNPESSPTQTASTTISYRVVSITQEEIDCKAMGGEFSVMIDMWTEEINEPYNGGEMKMLYRVEKGMRIICKKDNEVLSEKVISV